MGCESCSPGPADGRTLVVTPPPGLRVCVLDPATGEERHDSGLYSKDLARVPGAEYRLARGPPPGALAVSPDGKRLAASVHHGQYVAVWDAETGKQIAQAGARLPRRRPPSHPTASRSLPSARPASATAGTSTP